MEVAPAREDMYILDAMPIIRIISIEADIMNTFVIKRFFLKEGTLLYKMYMPEEDYKCF